MLYEVITEAIIEKIISLIKLAKIREIAYIRDETDKNGLKIAIDLKRGTDPDKLMQKLFKLTPLQDTFSCNFNILINGYPRVMGVNDILTEWIEFRKNCIKRRVSFDLKKKKEKLHLLKGLKKILLDIDKAIRLIRETEEESDVVPNLMIGFAIDEIQAEYVAEIKLRHLNREYILKRTNEIDQLEKEIAQMLELLDSDKKLKQVIIDELKDVAGRFSKARRTMLYYTDTSDESEIEEEIPDYPVSIFLSKSGYFKKITPQSLRMSGEQKLKESDVIEIEIETSNKAEILFFTDKAQVYKTKASYFDDTKASVLGDYIPAKLGFDEDENVACMIVTNDYSGFMIFAFENGKVSKVPLSAYETKTNRKKLTNAYSAKQKLVKILFAAEHTDIMLRSSNGRMVIFNSALLLPKTTRDTIGVQVMSLKAKSVVDKAFIVDDTTMKELEKYVTKSIPVAGSFAKDIEDPDQLHF